MTEGERSALRTATIVVLMSAGLRWGVDRMRPHDDPLAGRADMALVLERASREKADDDAQRSRPLAPGERIDANRASEAELDRLPGVGPALAATWVEHRERVGGFRSPADLLAIRGVGSATVARLEPLLQFSATRSMLQRREDGFVVPRSAGSGRDSPSVNLNRTDSAGLESLPGIGPALAGRILARRRQARFERVDDLLEVRGIGPATLGRLRPLVVVR